MHGRVTTTMLDPHTAVLRVSGLSDGATIELLDRELRRQVNRHRHTVVNLDELAIVDVNAIRRFLATLGALGPGSVALACRRLSCRRLVRHLAGDGVPIHARVADALARPLAPAGRASAAG